MEYEKLGIVEHRKIFYGTSQRVKYFLILARFCSCFLQHRKFSSAPNFLYYLFVSEKFPINFSYHFSDLKSFLELIFYTNFPISKILPDTKFFLLHFRSGKFSLA